MVAMQVFRALSLFISGALLLTACESEEVSNARNERFSVTANRLEGMATVSCALEVQVQSQSPSTPSRTLIYESGCHDSVSLSLDRTNIVFVRAWQPWRQRRFTYYIANLNFWSGRTFEISSHWRAEPHSGGDSILVPGGIAITHPMNGLPRTIHLEFLYSWSEELYTMDVYCVDADWIRVIDKSEKFLVIETLWSEAPEPTRFQIDFASKTVIKVARD